MDALAVKYLFEVRGAGFQFVLPRALAHADDDSALVVHPDVRVVPRHVGQIPAGCVLIQEVVHIIAEEALGVIQAGQREHRAEEVGTAEEEVRRVHRAHRRAEGHDGLVVPVALAGQMADIGHQLVDHIVVPSLMLLNAPARIAAAVGIGLAVDDVDGEDHDLPAFDPLGPGIDHVEVFKVVEPARLAGDEHHGLAAVAVDLEFHIAAETAAVVLKIADFHSVSPSS